MEIKNTNTIRELPYSGMGKRAAPQDGIEDLKDTFIQSGKPDKKEIHCPEPILSDAVKRLLGKPPGKEKIQLADAAQWKYEPEDGYNIEESINTPAGTSYLLCYGETQWGESRTYTAAFNANGSEMWKYRADDGYIIEEQAFLPDGTSYMMCNNQDRGCGAYIAALNPDGTEKWRFRYYDVQEYPQQFNSMNVNPDGTLFVRAGKKICTLDQKGQIKKSSKSIRFLTKTDDYTHEATSGKGILVLAAHRKNKCYGIDLSTNHTWKIEIDRNDSIESIQKGKDGNIYVEGIDTLYIVNPNGKLIRKQSTDKWGGPEVFNNVSPALFHETRDGSLFHSFIEKNIIEQIDASGNVVKQIDIPGGFTHFAPDNRGNLYIQQDDGTIIFLNMESDQRVSFPMKIPEYAAIKEVLDDGTLVFQGECEIYHIRLNKDNEKKKLQEKARKLAEEEIAITDNWVMIGNVRIHRN